MLRKMRNMINKKGQGIIEYALILAFVVGIAMMTLKGVNLGDAIMDTFDKVVVLLGGGEENSYAQRTSKWRQYKTDSELRANTTSEERLESDQELLISIANLFLGKQLSDVENMLSQYNTHIAYGTAEDPTGYIWNSRTNNSDPEDNSVKESGDVTLFEYREPNYQQTDQTIRVLNDNTHDYRISAELITQGTVKASDFNSSLDTNQRVFYSDGMIDQGYSRRLNARFGVDENTKEITSVHLYVRRGTGGGNGAIDGMDLTVTKSGVTYHNGMSY